MFLLQFIYFSFNCYKVHKNNFSITAIYFKGFLIQNPCKFLICEQKQFCIGCYRCKISKFITTNGRKWRVNFTLKKRYFVTHQDVLHNLWWNLIKSFHYSSAHEYLSTILYSKPVTYTLHFYEDEERCFPVPIDKIFSYIVLVTRVYPSQFYDINFKRSEWRWNWSNK